MKDDLMPKKLTCIPNLQERTEQSITETAPCYTKPQAKDLDNSQAECIGEKAEFNTKFAELTRQLIRQHHDKQRAQFQKDMDRLTADRAAFTTERKYLRSMADKRSLERDELRNMVTKELSHLRAEHDAARAELSRERAEFKAERKELAHERAELQMMSDQLARQNRQLKPRSGSTCGQPAKSTLATLATKCGPDHRSIHKSLRLRGSRQRPGAKRR